MKKKNNDSNKNRKNRRIRPYIGQERAERIKENDPIPGRRLILNRVGCLVTIEEHLENLKSGENQ